MNEIKINEQIAFLRKQNGLTQAELAGALGVTNHVSVIIGLNQGKPNKIGVCIDKSYFLCPVGLR